MNGDSKDPFYLRIVGYLAAGVMYLVAATVVGFVISLFFDPLSAKGTDPLNIGDFVALWAYVLAALVVYWLALEAWGAVAADVENQRKRKRKPMEDLTSQVTELEAEVRQLRGRVQELEDDQSRE